MVNCEKCKKSFRTKELTTKRCGDCNYLMILCYYCYIDLLRTLTDPLLEKKEILCVSCIRNKKLNEIL